MPVSQERPFYERVMDWLRHGSSHKIVGATQQEAAFLSDTPDMAYSLKGGADPMEDHQAMSEEIFWSMLQSVSSRDAYMHHLYSKALHSPSRKLKLLLVNELNKMMIVDETFAQFMDTSTSNLHFCKKTSGEECHDQYVPSDFDCLRSMVGTYEKHCGPFTDYARKFIKYLVRECEDPTMS